LGLVWEKLTNKLPRRTYQIRSQKNRRARANKKGHAQKKSSSEEKKGRPNC